jgi:hypothetical protein
MGTLSRHEHLRRGRATSLPFEIPVNSASLFLVLNCTLRHARVAALVVLALLLVLVVISPSFCVGFGLAVLAMIVTKWPCARA